VKVCLGAIDPLCPPASGSMGDSTFFSARASGDLHKTLAAGGRPPATPLRWDLGSEMNDLSQALHDDVHRLKRIAFAVVRDEARADDVLQEAWILTLDRRPPARSDRRAWLGGVVRNLALNALRAERRRSRRERSAARCERVEPDTEPVDLRAALDHLVECVEQLEEPLRTPVRLHYLEGLEVRQVAAELRRPVPTVRDQLRRALEVLRRRMGASFGDSRAWGLALIGAFDWRPREVRDALGSSLGRTLGRYVLPAAVLGVGLLTAWVATRPEMGGGSTAEPSVVPSVASAGEGAAPASIASTPTDAELADVRQSAPPDAVAGAPAADSASAPYARLELRVIDEFGAPVPGTKVNVLRPLAPIVQGAGINPMGGHLETLEASLTDSDGRARLEVRSEWLSETTRGEPGLSFRCSGPGFAAPWNYTVALESGDDVLVPIVLDEVACPFVVRTVDEHGQPVVSQGIFVTDPRREAVVLREGRLERRVGGISSPAGVVGGHEFANVRCGSMQLLTFVEGVGFGTERIDVGTQETFQLSVGPARRVRGRVLAQDGTPLAGAAVRCLLLEANFMPPKWSTATTDQDGAYSFWIGDEPHVGIAAEHPDVPGALVQKLVPYSSGHDEEMDLVIGHFDSLRVRLLDLARRPLAGWAARVVDRDRSTLGVSLYPLTDEQGRVELQVRGADPVDLGVVGNNEPQGLVRWVFPQLAPGEQEHELVLDHETRGDCAILGELVADDWEPDCNFRLLVCQPASGLVSPYELPCPGEVFTVEGLPTGGMELWLRGPGALMMPLGTYTMTGDGFIDLGAVAIPRPTKVRFQLQRGGQGWDSILRSAVHAGGPNCSEQCLARTGGLEEPIELFPGEYRLQLYTSASEFTLVKATIPPGRSECLFQVTF
jgi:RNA polymerase sigma factor (sigma-70 family)